MQVPIPTRTGARFRTSLIAEEYKTVLLNANIVRIATSRDDITKFSHTSIGTGLKNRLKDLECRTNFGSISAEQLPSASPKARLVASARVKSTGSTTTPQHTSQLQSRLSGVGIQHCTLFPPEHHFKPLRANSDCVAISTRPLPYASLDYAELNQDCVPNARSEACRSMLPTTGVLYSAYVELTYQAYADKIETAPVEQRYCTDEEIGPFSTSYASLAGHKVFRENIGPRRGSFPSS